MQGAEHLCVSIFESLTNPLAHTLSLRWDQLPSLLTHEICAAKESRKLFNFCQFSTPYRANRNVTAVYALLLDVDDQPASVVLGLTQKLQDYSYFGYSTHRHGLEPNVYRLRVVVQLSRPVFAEEWPGFAATVQRWLGSALDGCVAIPSQAYYLPSCPPERADQRLVFANEGAALDVGALVASAPVTAADETPDSWRPEQIFTLEHLRGLTGDVPARLLRGEKLAPKGERHETRRNLVFQFLVMYGPGEPDAALLHLLTCSADAPRETWVREFSRGSARAKAEAVYARLCVAEAQSQALSQIAVQREAEASAAVSAALSQARSEAQTAFTDLLVKEIAKKAKDPATKLVLQAACVGAGIPDELTGAITEAGRWLGYREANRGAGAIKRAFLHTPGADRERLFAGIDLGVAQATNKEVWRKGLTLIEDRAAPCESNIRVVLLEHPLCKGQLVYDVRSDKVRVGSVPWARGPSAYWTASDAGGAMAWVTDTLGCAIKTAAVETALEGLKEQLPVYDAVAAYLQALPPWDGTQRLSLWLHRFAGAHDTAYTRKVARASLIACVARALKPGCQADQTVVLEGAQGIRKTSLLRALCPDDSWFLTLEGALSLDNVRMLHKMQGAWICELGELAGLKRSQQESTKAFLSERIDNYRAPYGRHVLTRPRRCVFFGTTNHSDYLVDATGNRRWLPIESTECNPSMLALDRDQLWAEAVQAFRAGEQCWVDQAPDVIAAQADRLQEHPLEGQVLECAEHFGEVSCRQIAAYIGLGNESRERYQLPSILRRAGYLVTPKKRRRIVMPFEGVLQGVEKDVNDRFWVRPGPLPGKVPG